ncbi:Peptide deformylase [subsurface metagenome]
MRNIVKVPNPILREVSKPVNNIDGYIKELASEMMAYMAGVSRIPCLGLAAVQLGELVRMVIIMGNMYSPDFREPVIIINPEIVRKSDKMVESREGCLSIGDGTQIFIVKRHKLVKVVGLDLNGARRSYKERGLPGFALQHEIDHLNGRLVSG